MQVEQGVMRSSPAHCQATWNPISIVPLQVSPRTDAVMRGGPLTIITLR
jgi:hypothetical protein